MRSRITIMNSLCRFSTDSKHGLNLQQKFITVLLMAILSFSGLPISGCGSGGGNETDISSNQTQEYSASNSNVTQAIKTNYLTVISDNYPLLQPTFYYSTVNESFWSIQANVATAVFDIDSKGIIRIDIPRTADGFPALDKTFSVERDTKNEKFPGSIFIFNGKKSTKNRVESGVISFSPDSIASQHVSGSYDIIMTDFDSGTSPPPRHRIKGIFSFKMGEYGPAETT